MSPEPTQSAVQSATKSSIAYADFDKLDIRVGTVIEASAPEWSAKLIRYVVDFGETIGKRVLFSGIRKWYAPEDLIGKQYCFVVNLEPKKMGEEESQGMMIMADTEKGPILTPFSQPVPNGTGVR
ncbi:MAG TPA: methionine--tRNA ligase [Candidatus Pacebacteria bacterium]|nr:MAG: Methionine-tRNA ligase [Microgenomates group bacterium GW2011_GWB1_45_17]KKU23395.1 MAG: Methionine-tRNA ligase [Microgenomates group bacterium GW2011_GWA1_46_15]KKU24475.1 MAG: Methionine-tRNA ligase [Microgenomates group bacterium GW2011_GWC1_46_15]HAV15579.1 methionine--tRNA ligase [Candidatus Paceibacterota bacterium]HCR10905.1 methionine--tRNA ligase [Candidatus Paceibacterota bacterium]